MSDNIEQRARANGVSPAYPHRSSDPVFHGLTKREEFAKAAMQGLLANPEMTKNFSATYDSDLMASDVMKLADALLRALEGGAE